MITETIIEDLLSGNISDAKNKTEELLYSKLSNILESGKNDITSIVYQNSGVAALVEKSKKSKKKDDDEEYSKKTDKEDDGEGLDPVDAEDSDVDNDGDSDESDDYLNNRRKVRKKKIRGDDDDDDNDDVKEDTNKGQGRDDSNKGDSRLSHIYGMPIKRYRNLTDSQKSAARRKWHQEKSHAEKTKAVK